MAFLRNSQSALSKPPAVAKIQPITQSSDSARAAIIDEFGRLSQKVAELRLAEKRYEQLRQIIVSWYENKDPASGYSESGDTYVLDLSPRPVKRWVADMEGVAKRIGLQRFYTLCSISLEQLDKLLAPADQGELVREDRIGPRVIKAVPKYIPEE